jgi:GxxExxY protein
MTRKEQDEEHLLERELTGSIIGAFYDCYNLLAFGYLESVYRRAMVIELELRGHTVSAEGYLEVRYRGVPVGGYRYDLLVDDRVLLEVKSTEKLGPHDERQLLNYLRASRIEVGLLLHFGPAPHVIRRVRQSSPLSVP